MAKNSIVIGTECMESVKLVSQVVNGKTVLDVYNRFDGHLIIHHYSERTVRLLHDALGEWLDNGEWK